MPAAAQGFDGSTNRFGVQDLFPAVWRASILSHPAGGRLLRQSPYDVGRLSTNFRYAGMFYLEEAGLYLTQYRVYDPKTGRWLSRDPIGEMGDINLYGYVGGNPVNFIDPTGKFGVITGVAVGVAIWVSSEVIWPNNPSDPDAIVASSFPDFTAMSGLAGSMIGKFCSSATKGEGRVFWSGGNVAKTAAADFAAANGMKTLDMTTSGRIMNSISLYLPKSISSPIWNKLSSNFAKGASGNINVFQNSAGVSINSTWRLVEYPILKNQNIIFNTTN